VLLLGGTVAAACGAGDGLPGAPDDLDTALAAMPATAVERGLFWSGDATDAPQGQWTAVASSLSVSDVDAVLESGAPPASVLLGGFAAADVVASGEAEGFRATAAGRWSLLVAPREGFVPALAARDGVLVAGDLAEVQAVVDGADTAADVEWLRRLSRATGGDARHVALAPSPDPDLPQHVRRTGATAPALLRQAGVREPLPAYAGYAISAAGTRGPGAVALALHDEVDGPATASALAIRLSTTGMVGQPSRRLVDQLEPGGARWHEAAGVIRVPVDWQAFDAAALRRDVEAQALAFLVPGEAD
jgi:hypothetical protein